CTALASAHSRPQRAYSSQASTPASAWATTITTSRTIESGSRKSFLIFTTSEESSCGGCGPEWGGPAGGPASEGPAAPAGPEDPGGPEGSGGPGGCCGSCWPCAGG